MKKFEDHIMLWLCFSEKGCSKPYFLNKRISINQYNYLKECIQKRVMLFIRQDHADNNYIFWSRNENKLSFVPKNDKPVNVPEYRPIEKFWAISK